MPMNPQKTLSCLIIEDEPIAAELLADYVNQVSFLELKGICKDALFALERLQEEPIDVIFLDIHLPKLKGLEFLGILRDKPQTILTTAYHQYALEAFEAEVVDYLMKPIAFPRFLKAVGKLDRGLVRSGELAVGSGELAVGSGELAGGSGELADSAEPFSGFYFFPVGKKKVKVFFEDILFVESQKDYLRIVSQEQEIVTRLSLSEMEEMLKPYGFLRIHRSYLVAVKQLSAYSASEVEIGGKTLPIGRSYKELVAQQMERFL